jgi:hypothetical protein
MLLCGIINELKKRPAKTDLLSFFFCQGTDSRINNATAVLRGLIYMLLDQQPSLIPHVRKNYDHAGKALFKDANAWVALSEIFTNILQDPGLKSAYLVIDALDECVTDLPKLLALVVKGSSASPRVKWIVSSRNWPSIEERLQKAGQKVKLCLELNEESISAAVRTYIGHQVDGLAQVKSYDNKTRDVVQKYMSANANDTFLWVALVCQELEKVSRRHTLAKLNAFPPGLDELYKRMLDQIHWLESDADLCKRILACLVVVYRPIMLEELMAFLDDLKDMLDNELAEIIGLCGSFLTLRDGTIYFVHQSAKDFLLTKASGDIFPSGAADVHHSIFSRSLLVLSKDLRRDIYGLVDPGFPIDKIPQPDPDPLAAARYSCVYWVDHLHDWHSAGSLKCLSDLEDGDTVDAFLRRCYLYWLEALSLLKSMSQGVLSMAKLEALLQVRFNRNAILPSHYTNLALERGKDLPAKRPRSRCTAVSSIPQVVNREQPSSDIHLSASLQPRPLHYSSFIQAGGATVD